jgi:OOP family OmpA-OmpF porin
MKRCLALAIPLTLTLLAGCALNPFSSNPVESAKNVTPSGGAFNQALYRAYLTRADEKMQIGERGSASYFADRAKLAAAGNAVIPEDVSADKLGDAFADLDAAHSNLIKSLVDGGRDRASEEAAQAQSYFDCWEKATEAKNASESARCKTAFNSALGNLQVALNSAPAGTAPSAVAQGREYKVYFGLDEWHLSAEALSTITDAINTARAEGQSQIVAAGHTDRSGGDAYNMKLSERRAGVVKDVMVEMGAREDAIKVESYGETKPAVDTADGVKEPKNRRVEISLIP